MVTTNKLVTQWGGLLGDEMTAAAILDRLLHHSYSQLFQGESYRMKKRKKAGLLQAKTLKTGAAKGGQVLRWGNTGGQKKMALDSRIKIA